VRSLDVRLVFDLDGPVPERVVAVAFEFGSLAGLNDLDRDRIDHALELVVDALARADLLDRTDAA